MYRKITVLYSDKYFVYDIVSCQLVNQLIYKYS